MHMHSIKVKHFGGLIRNCGHLFPTREHRLLRIPESVFELEYTVYTRSSNAHSVVGGC
jgi:hypothetical protein